MRGKFESDQPYKQAESKMAKWKQQGRFQAISKILSLCQCRNSQISNPVKTKEKKIAHMGSNRCQFNKRNCQVFIIIKKM